MSGRLLGLSELLAEAMPGPVQAQVRGIDRDAQHFGDLGRAEILPGPQPPHLGIGGSGRSSIRRQQTSRVSARTSSAVAGSVRRAK